jgi:O-methyltransferase involved in polyketide biosynthesis
MAKVDLTGERATLLATLHARALDARSERPVLGDPTAARVEEQIEFDFDAVGLRPGDELSVALRARHIDTWTREFLAENPRCVVLHLGCGLDGRAHRVDPGPGVRWFDVDHPDVIDLRRRLLPAREGCETIGSSVADPAWLERVPADLPVLVVAEGLTMYLTEDEGRTLVRRVVEHAPSGRMVFDGLSGRGISLQRFNKAVQAAGATLHWGIEGAADLESIHPRVRCTRALSAFDVDGVDRLRVGFRVLARLAGLVPVIRRSAVFYRLDF